MLTDRPADVVLTELLDALPDAVIWMRAIRDKANRVINFRTDYANQKAKDIGEENYWIHVGAQLLHTNGHEQKDPTNEFRAMCGVLEVNQPHEVSHFDSRINSWIITSWSKLNDGVLIVVRTLPKTNDPVDSASINQLADRTDTRFNGHGRENQKGQQDSEQAAADLQAVIDNSQTGIFVFSPVYDEAGKHIDFRFKTINRMVAQLVGQTPDKLTGEVASDWFISYRETGLFDRYRHTYDTGEEQHFDIHYNVDGFDVWFDVKSIKFGNDVLVTFTDYTSLKQANQAVGRQADLLNSVLNGSINGIMAFEAIRNGEGVIQDFRFLSANEAGCHLVGKSAHELIGSTMLTSFPGNSQTGLFDHYVHTTETGQPVRTETYYKHDGLDIWFDISTQKLGDGFVVTFTDVSIVKRAAAAVEQSADELRTVIDSAQVAIYLINPVWDEKGQIDDFRFRTANQMLASYVGLEPDTLTGELVSRWFPGYVENGLFSRYIAVYETGRTQHFNINYKTDKINLWINVTATKRDNDLLITFSDYTPLKRLQQQLENSVIDLQRSNNNLEQFAYVASHDLQEPLRKIQAFGDILQSQYASVIGDSGADMIGRMQSAAARMQVLIKDVLAYSRITTKRETAGPVDLNQVMSEVLTDLDNAIADKQATVTVDPLPTVRGDNAQLRQLFQNLISNALKFTKTDPAAASPAITITTHRACGRDLPGMTLLPADADQSFHLIELTDNGIGFDPHQAERIFQVFQRLHSRTAYQGTGIGLAIVQKVVENHNGYIIAEGRPGEGATFRIALPT